MLTNGDGTRYALESVEEEIDRRCEKNDFPYLSDVLGSDWGAIFGAPRDTAEYAKNAKKAAAYHYQYS